MLLTTLTDAWRRLHRPGNRGYALAAIATLALGIGAVVAVYGILHKVMLEPLPFADEERVVRLAGRNDARGVDGFAVSAADFQSWREQARGFAAMAGYKERGANLVADDGVERVPALQVAGPMTAVTGVAPLLGRALSERPADAGAMLISESLWQRRFERSADVLGRTLRIDGVERSIVGVMPDRIGLAADAEVWLPLALTGREVEHRGDRRLTVVARLAEGIGLQPAQAEMRAIAARLAAVYPDSNADWSVDVVPVREWLVGPDDRLRLALVFGAVALLLAATCMNLAGLQLARAADRQRELGVRQAIGAGRARLAVDLLAETLLLVLAGVLLGLPLAAFLLELAAQSLQASMPRLAGLRMEPLVALVAVLACALTALGFALIPAAAAARSDPAAALSASRSNLGARRAPLRTGLVVAQFAVATVLLTGALVLGGRLSSLASTDLGFAPSQVLTGRIGLPVISTQEELDTQRRALEQLVDEVGALPGVRSAAVTSDVPLGSVDTQMLVAPGPMPVELTPAETHVQASWRIVSGGYFDALGVPLVAGRLLREHDESPESAVLSRSLATTVFGGEEAVGRTITLGNGQRKQVVGVVGDTHQRSVDGGPSPAIYFPTTWYLWETMALTVRTEGDPLALVPAVRERAARVFPDRALYDLRSMEDVVSTSIAKPRLQAMVVSGFALAALLIAAVGIGGVMAYLIARRTAEFALRFALGALPSRVRGRVLGSAALRATGGIVVGAMALVAVVRFAPAGVVDVGGGVLPALAMAGAALLLACLVAVWIPARRAARIAPAQALRAEG